MSRFNEYEVDLSYKQLYTIPQCKYNIRFLFINNNSLTSIDLSLFTHLEVIDVSDNEITTIANYPKTLKELVCRNNKIKCLTTIDALERLDCSDNLIKHIPSFPNIVKIICSNNGICKINTFSNLQYLCCDNNPIIQINKQPNLIFANCSNTKLHGIITDFPLLQKLVCNHTSVIDVILPCIQLIEIVNTKVMTLSYNPCLEYITCNNEIKLDEKYVIKKCGRHGNSNVSIEFKIEK